MNFTCITFVHQPEDFSVNQQVGVDSEVHFPLTRSNFIQYNLQLRDYQHVVEQKTETPTAVAAIATAILGTSREKTSGNNLPTAVGPV